MAVEYPMQYGHSTGTLDEMMAELVVHGHPEYVRRLRIWLIDQDGRIGIGDAWRAKQPSRAGFAPEGQSFHQGQRFASGFIGCCAVDLVALRPGAAHRSPTWKEVPKQGGTLAKRYGVHCNVDGEPWHMQPIEIDGWSSWVNDGRRDPVAGYGSPIPPSTPPSGGLSKVAPGGSPSFRLGASDASTVTAEWPSGRVSTLQQIMNERFGSTLTVDGEFGQATHNAVLVMQGVLGVTRDGIYGQQTAAALAEWLAVH